MPSYHITENGPKPCSTTPNKCPITKETGEDHYSDFDKAQSQYEKKMIYDFSVDSAKTSKFLKPLIIPPVENVEERIDEINNHMSSMMDNNKLDAETEDYLRKFMNGEIPERLPSRIAGGTPWIGMDTGTDFFSSSITHSAALDSGYYAKITERFAGNLAEKIGKDSIILDPMAGKGYFVKAMREQGIKTIGSDDKSWKTANPGEDNGIENISAIDSLKKYGNKIDHLVVSWAPYESDIDDKLYEIVKKDYPHITLINIGEGMGGCTGSEKFWDNLDEDNENGLIEMDSNDQYGYETTSVLHDFVTFVKIK